MFQRGLGARGGIGGSACGREEIERNPKRIGIGAGKLRIAIEFQRSNRRSHHARESSPFAAAWVKAARLAASVFIISVVSAR